MPKLGEFLFGKKAKVKQATTLTPEQEQLMDLITKGLTGGEGPLADIFGGFNKEAFEEGVAKPALKNFQENILPQLQEKFISGNQVLGSGMRQGQLKAAQSLQSDLAKLLYEAQQAQKQNKLAGLQTSLGTRAFENLYRPEKKGAAQGVWEAFAQGLGQSAGGYAGGGFGGFGGGNASQGAQMYDNEFRRTGVPIAG